MLRIYSKGCEHVLRALTRIPLDQCDQQFLARDICRQAKVPETPTRKSLQALVKAGLLAAVTGPGGGYRFAVHPSKISLFLIITAVDGEAVFNQCIMGLPECSQCQPCPIHESWAKLKGQMVRELERKTIGQLMQTVKERQ
ncbi:MAG: Rrf2 family transcriptional regulator [Candidatus Omnitrophica bacterium]|nr:Rrf2 family transcriptional regulator [Candidatus Omnitrophota bacterium]